MSPEQLKLARHALGLPNNFMRSYRNRYAAGIGTTQEAAWDDLVSKGMAERGTNGIAIVGFCLTLEGAKAALEPAETLDREDFPEAAEA